MLKYKRYTHASILDGAEALTDMLAGMTGKNRRVVSITSTQTALMYLRIYRDSEQFVDLVSTVGTATAPLIPLDIPLAEGQLLKVGFWNNTGGTITVKEIAIGYEETG